MVKRLGGSAPTCATSYMLMHIFSSRDAKRSTRRSCAPLGSAVTWAAIVCVPPAPELMKV